MSETKDVVKEKIQVNNSLKEPPLFSVVYLNDNITTFEFVISSLVHIFGVTIETATEIAKKVHLDGSGIVATMPYEMAEQKIEEVHLFARNNQMPLTAKIEPALP